MKNVISKCKMQIRKIESFTDNESVGSKNKVSHAWFSYNSFLIDLAFNQNYTCLLYLDKNVISADLFKVQV